MFCGLYPSTYRFYLEIWMKETSGDPNGLKLKQRSALRLKLGTAYYSIRRYAMRHSGKYRFASERQRESLPYVHMSHHTLLEVTERRRHGYDVFPDSNRTQPFGSGATCFYPYGALMIYNPTDRPFQLCLRVRERELEGEWCSDQAPRLRDQIVERGHEMP